MDPLALLLLVIVAFLAVALAVALWKLSGLARARRPELGAEAKDAIVKAFKPVHLGYGEALRVVTEAGLTGETLFSAEKGYLLSRCSEAVELL
jgi:hypothetical protein